MKKGNAIGIIVVMVVAIAFVVVSIGMIASFKKVPAIDDISDNLCRQKINLLASDAQGKALEEITNYLAVEMFEFQKKCTTRVVPIDPNDWDKCDQKFKMRSISSRIQAETDCVTQQIAELVTRCWSMNGEGRWDGYNWACFNAVVGDQDEESVTSQVRTRVNDLFNCASPSANNLCRKYANDIFEKEGQVIAVYSSYINTLKANIKNTMSFCGKNDAKINGENLMNENPHEEGVYETNWNTVELWYDNIHNYYENNNRISQNLIDPYLAEPETDDSDDPCKKNNVNSAFNEALKGIIGAEEEVIDYYDTVSQKFCDSRMPGYECDNDTNIFGDITRTIGGESSTERITPENFKEFISSNTILGREIFYDDFIASDQIEFFADTPVIAGETFQVVYCDGLLPIGSGLRAQEICGVGKKILISNTLTAGGARLAAENFAASCPMTETLAGLSDSDIAKGIVGMCQHITL